VKEGNQNGRNRNCYPTLNDDDHDDDDADILQRMTQSVGSREKTEPIWMRMKFSFWMDYPNLEAMRKLSSVSRRVRNSR
jgi:hypothetical protein